MCFDKDASLNASERFQCVCPPGLIGDGITSCNVYSYETRFSLVKRGVALDTFDKAAFKLVLASRGVIPAEIPENRLSIMFSEYLGGASSRRLLQSGSPDTQVDVAIFSETVGEMNTITQVGLAHF
jgi:hypothetical protein